MARLQGAVDANKFQTYQFDTLPSLAKRQRAVTLKEAKGLATSLQSDAVKLTDAELEDAAREARRARRRKERGAE